MIDESKIVLVLDWQGQAGRHVVRLDQTLAEGGVPELEEAIVNAVALFRNVVGFEVIDDAVSSGGWPGSDPDEASDGPDEWR
jgi:hypothetical protein